MATITRGNISEMTIMYHNVVTNHALIKPKEHEQITNYACSLKPVSCLCLLLRTLRHLCLDSSWNDMMGHKSYQTNCFLQSIFFPAFCYYFSIPLKINISFMDMIILLVLFLWGVGVGNTPTLLNKTNRVYHSHILIQRVKQNSSAICNGGIQLVCTS